MAEFREDIGSASKDGKTVTFVRVVHLPSGKEKIVMGLGGRSLDEVTDRLKNETLDELPKT